MLSGAPAKWWKRGGTSATIGWPSRRSCGQAVSREAAGLAQRTWPPASRTIVGTTIASHIRSASWPSSALIPRPQSYRVRHLVSTALAWRLLEPGQTLVGLLEAAATVELGALQRVAVAHAQAGDGEAGEEHD